MVELLSASAAPCLGRYTCVPLTKEDSAKQKQHQFVVTYEKRILKGRFDPNDSYMNKCALTRIGPDTFAPGIYDEKGVIYDVLRPDLIIDFSLVNGRATSLECATIPTSWKGAPCALKAALGYCLFVVSIHAANACRNVEKNSLVALFVKLKSASISSPACDTYASGCAIVSTFTYTSA